MFCNEEESSEMMDNIYSNTSASFCYRVINIWGNVSFASGGESELALTMFPTSVRSIDHF